MAKSEELKTLWDEINCKRKQLNEFYEQEGTSLRTLALSHEIDELLNKYSKIYEIEKNEL